MVVGDKHIFTKYTQESVLVWTKLQSQDLICGLVCVAMDRGEVDNDNDSAG